MQKMIIKTVKSQNAACISFFQFRSGSGRFADSKNSKKLVLQALLKVYTILEPSAETHFDLYLLC